MAASARRQHEADSLKQNQNIEIGSVEASRVLCRMVRQKKLSVPGFRLGKAPPGLIWQYYPSETGRELTSFIRERMPAELEKWLEGASTIPEYHALGFNEKGGFEMEVSYFALPEPPAPETLYHAQGGDLGRKEITQPAPGQAPGITAFLPPATQQQMRDSGLRLGGPSSIAKLQGAETHASGSHTQELYKRGVDLPSPEQRLNERTAVSLPHASSGVKSPSAAIPDGGAVADNDISATKTGKQGAADKKTHLPVAKTPDTPQVLQQVESVRDSSSIQHNGRMGE